MDHDNPYRAPIAHDIVDLPDTSTGSIWRDGKLLVVEKGARLPPICVKTSTPAQIEIFRKFYWHSQWLYVLVIVQILIYIIAALAVRKQQDLTIPLSEAAAKKRSSGIMSGWLAGGVGFALFVVAMILAADSNMSGTVAVLCVALGFIGIFLSLAGLALGLPASNILTAKKITDQAGWFRGVHQDYLQSLPVLPSRIR